MNGGLLLIPFLGIRMILPSLLAKDALQRAAFFAPVQGKEKIAYWIYQLSDIEIFLSLFFLKIQTDISWLFYVGASAYLSGLVLCAISIVNFSHPDGAGMNKNGIYQYSRNPMYVAYFVCFMGMALLTRSKGLAVLVLIFQVSAHWIILAEERWCLQKFGEDYEQYRKTVRRYL